MIKRLLITAWLCLPFFGAVLPCVAAKCTGSANCAACKNCSACKHCSVQGGKCGVCSRIGNERTLTPDATKQQRFSNKCVGISDGDTISVMHNGKEVKVRLWGIDCPEKSQAFGTKAKQFTSDKVFDKTVTVDVKDVDRYGRLVAVVYAPTGERLNDELVKAGMAWWYKRFAPSAMWLSEYEAKARADKVGLWADEKPVAPWESRRK